MALLHPTLNFVLKQKSPHSAITSHSISALLIIVILFCVGCRPQSSNQSVGIQIVGVYPVDAPEPCHLLEIEIKGAENPVELGQFTQDIPGKLRGNLQVPWMEQILSVDGTRVVATPEDVSRSPDLLRGNIRIVFFFHYLNLDWPLTTPYGQLQLPTTSKLPKRLSVIKYEAPS